jgi:hypothetical protein
MQMMREYCGSLIEQVQGKFLAEDIYDLAVGFNSLVLPHQHDVSAGLIKWILSSPEIMNELLTKYFDYLHQKAREKEGK